MATDSVLSHLPPDLGDGLVMRLAGEADAERLIEFHRRMHSEGVAAWTHDLTCGRHPTSRVGDFALVEDVGEGKIVSTVCLISQTWSYGGVPFPVGQPEIVVTDEQYRRRGLVRRLFEVIHALSAARGQLMLGITGIPWFYRQFGYEMALSLGGGRGVPVGHVAGLEDGEACALRPATADDRPFIRQVCERAAQRQPFAGVRSEEEWRYEFEGRSEKSDRRGAWSVIQDADGSRLGYVLHAPRPRDGRFVVGQLEYAEGACYLDRMPGLLRHLRVYGQSLASEGQGGRVDTLMLWLGGDHPLYAPLEGAVSVEEPYAWYIRVPDLVAFLNRVRPALERNLEGTIAAGVTRECKLSFFRSGLRLQLDRGRITAIEAWPPVPGAAEAAFPDLTFLQLLCGRRRVEELQAAFPDCRAGRATAALLDCLFPPFRGKLWHMS